MSIVERGAFNLGEVGLTRDQAISPVAARYYGHRATFGGVAATLALVADTLYGVPFIPPADMVVNQIAVNITGAAGAGKLLRIGLYTGNKFGLPGSLLATSGAIAADATGIKTATINANLKAGQLYFFAAVSDGTPTVTSTTGSRAVYGATDATDSAGGASVTRTFTYAALPTAWGTVAAYVGPTPYIVVRAVP